MDNLVFHSRFTSNSDPRVTIVGKRLIGNNLLRLAVARCSKKDQYAKTIGRKIAKGRLDKGDKVIDIIVDPSKNIRKQFNEASVGIAEKIIRQANIIKQRQQTLKLTN